MTLFATAEAISFRVDGVPVPQGSKKILHHPRKPEIAWMVDVNKKELERWRNTVAAEARRFAPERLWDGPVRMRTAFYRQAPAARTGQLYDYTGPDGDKLTRAVWDALTKVIITNDARVAEWSGGKYFTDDDTEGYCLVSIEQIDPVIVKESRLDR